MRIDSLGSTEASTVSTERSATAAASTGQAEYNSGPQDRATLSPASNTLASLSSAALQAAPAREAKVEALRQSVANGTYKIDPSSTAEAMIGGED